MDDKGEWDQNDYLAAFSRPGEAWMQGSSMSPKAQFDPNWASNNAAGQILSQEGSNNNLRGLNNALQPTLMAGAVRTQAANPYQSAVADQSRAAQMALIQQMRAQAAGPSLAAMQGQRAMGQMGQQAIGQGGRGAMLGAQGAGAGLAADTGQARLAELMRARAGMGGAASQLRGGDLRSAEQQQSAGLQAQGLSDQGNRAMAGMGVGLSSATRNADLEKYKMYQRLGLQNKAAAAKDRDTFMQILSTMLSAI